MRPILAVVIAVSAPWAVPAVAQQILEADPEAGRVLIDGPFRAISPTPWMVGISEDTRTLYLHDWEEPEGVMAFSFDTGEWVRTVPIRRGDGPSELRWITSITPASDGGMYVSGAERVLEFDSVGGLERDWSVHDLTGRNVCEMDGRPAVISEAGHLVRRGANGEDEVIGEWTLGTTLRAAYLRTLLACSDGTAYVMTVPESGPIGSFSVLRQGRPVGELETALFLEKPEDWRRSGFLTYGDSRGNIVVVTPDNQAWGAVIDPRTGCYAVLRNTGRSGFGSLAGIYADSAVVLHRDYEEFRDGRRTVVRVYDVAARVSLVPFRRTSGNPCPGMFPSLDEATGAARGKERPRSSSTACACPVHRPSMRAGGFAAAA